MTDLYIIEAMYGEWEDHCETDVFFTADNVEALAMFESIKTDLKATFAEMIDRRAHGCFDGFYEDGYTISEPLWHLAMSGYHNDGLILHLKAVPMGQLLHNSTQIVQREIIDFVTDSTYTVDSPNAPNVFEMLGEVFEQRTHGWKY